MSLKKNTQTSIHYSDEVKFILKQNWTLISGDSGDSMYNGISFTSEYGYLAASMISGVCWSYVKVEIVNGREIYLVNDFMWDCQWGGISKLPGYKKNEKLATVRLDKNKQLKVTYIIARLQPLMTKNNLDLAGTYKVFKL